MIVYPAAVYLGVVVAAITEDLSLAGAIVAIVVAVYGAFYRSSYKAASARADELEKSLALERSRHEEAASERREALQLVAAQKETIARLEALPNLERVIRFMGESMERVDKHSGERLAAGMAEVEALAAAHETSAQQRHAELLEAIRR